jgi:hypothetical protein
MSEVKIGTRKKFGPYKGSKQNGGREIYVWKVKTKDGWRTESKNKARADYEDTHGKLSKNTDVDHKDNNKKNDSKGNLRAMSHGKNVAKENKRRVGKKENEK